MLHHLPKSAHSLQMYQVLVVVSVGFAFSTNTESVIRRRIMFPASQEQHSHSCMWQSRVCHGARSGGAQTAEHEPRMAVAAPEVT